MARKKTKRVGKVRRKRSKTKRSKVSRLWGRKKTPKRRAAKRPARRGAKPSRLKRARRTRGAQHTDNWVFGLVAGAVFLVFSVWWASVKSPTTTIEAMNHFKQTKKLGSVGARVNYWSRAIAEDVKANGKLVLMGRSPSVPDSAPLIPKKFDCTTYVETVAALSRSRTAGDFFKELKKIRYKNGKPYFEARNHFPSLDWIPNNVKAGAIRDITASVAKTARVDVKTEDKRINRKAWLKRKLKKGEVERGIASPAVVKWKDARKAEVKYIPLDEVDEAMEHIPSGTIVNLVRKDTSGQDVLVSHQGFVIRYKGKLYFRHSTSKGQIQTTEFKGYLERRAKNSAWPVLGVNLNKIKG